MDKAVTKRPIMRKQEMLDKREKTADRSFPTTMT